MKFELNEYHKNISKDELLEDLCIVAKKLNKSYHSRSEYEKNGYKIYLDKNDKLYR